MNPRRDLFWPSVTAFLAFALAALLYDVGGAAIQLGRFAGSLKWRLTVLAIAALFLAVLACFLLTWTARWPRLAALLSSLGKRLERLGILNLLALLPLYAFYALAVFFPRPPLFSDPATFAGLWARLGLLFVLGLAAAPFLRAALPRLSSAQASALGVLFLALLHRALVFLPDLSASPFTLGWSEASRFYYGSLFQSASVYGQPAPLPFLHPSRYLLLSLPFLLPGLPIWAHRLWQDLLWLGMSALNAWLLVRRLPLKGAAARWIAAGWAFLFLFQGPVYYHLLVCSALVLAFFDRRRFARSLLAVGLASLWAGISRVNWLPVPAFLALALYLLETPLAAGQTLAAFLRPSAADWKRLLAYLRQPALWSLAGLALAYAANRLYAPLSGQPDPSVFKSTFSQDLLWYRLWPSPTYPPGILPMILLVSLPLLLLILVDLARARLHPLRCLGLAAMLTVLLLGGLVVSVKIGGGSNLHNLDAYLLLLLVWGAYLLASAAPSEPGGRADWRPAWLLVLALCLPLAPLLQEGQPVHFPDPQQDREVLASLQAEVARAAAKGPVLFIWQRQLLTFHQVQGVALIPEYETVDLMEMAMANNPSYLGRFNADLQAHRFALIVVDQQNGLIKSGEDSFPEENNVWVRRITAPLLASYRERAHYPNGIQLLEPKP